MSDTENIDHEAEARKWLDPKMWKQENPKDDALVAMVAISQVHATLALVQAQRKATEQARIANLIALADSSLGPLMSAGHRALVDNVPHPEWSNTTVEDLRPEIQKGLGLS